MEKHDLSRAMALITAPVMATMALLLLFLLLGWTGPISHAKVFVWDRDGGSGFTGTVTDGSGAYSITLEEGRATTISSSIDLWGTHASHSLKGITGPPDQIRNVALAPGHSVSGTVRAPDGTSVGGVCIHAFNHDTAEGFGMGFTDTNGQYCIGLVEGHYDLGFTPPPCSGPGPAAETITFT